MNASEEAAVNECRFELVHRINLTQTLLRLRAGHPPTIVTVDAERIRSLAHTKSELDGAELLLDTLGRSSGSFAALLAALDSSNQGELAEKLRENELKHRRYLKVDAAMAAFNAVLRPKLLAEETGESPPLLSQKTPEELTAAVCSYFQLVDDNIRLQQDLDEEKSNVLRLTSEATISTDKMAKVEARLDELTSEGSALLKDNKRLQRGWDEEKAKVQRLSDESELVKELAKLEMDRDDKANELARTQLALKEANAHGNKLDTTLKTTVASNNKLKIDRDDKVRKLDAALLPTLIRALIVGGRESKKTMEALSLRDGSRKESSLKKGLDALACARTSDGRALVAGGGLKDDTSRNKCFYVDPVTLKTTDGPSLPLAMVNHAMVTIGDTVFLTGLKTKPTTSKCWVLRQGKWNTFNKMSTPRECHGSATDGSRLGIFGGDLDNTNDNFTSTVELYSPGANVWTQGPSFAEERSGLRTAFLDGRFYAVGGSEKGYAIKTTEAWDPRTDEPWKALSPMPTDRAFHGLLALQGKLYAFGGSGGYNELDTVESYEPRVNRWELLDIKMSQPGFDFGFCAI